MFGYPDVTLFLLLNTSVHELCSHHVVKPMVRELGDFQIIQRLCGINRKIFMKHA